MSWVDLLGYVASASVLLTFCVSTMVPLRMIAIASNVLFATFGAVAHIYPVLVLHVILFPINIARLIQIRRLVQGARTANDTELSIDTLLPFMSRRTLKAGETLVRKGEKADRIYYLTHGRMKIVEFGKSIEPGTVLGEIGVFARNQHRMATIICCSDCEVYELRDSKAKQLYFQDPSFGLAVLQLIISRFLEDLNTKPLADSEPERNPMSPDAVVHVPAAAAE